ncbi:MAG: hypothetical protein C5B54_12535 [Acidobacteria bacterium]|nr:MAG: hypothetical protein C5B54_12535 [Acidobacteriota bacterium]
MNLRKWVQPAAAVVVLPHVSQSSILKWDASKHPRVSEGSHAGEFTTVGFTYAPSSTFEDDISDSIDGQLDADYRHWHQGVTSEQVTATLTKAKQEATDHARRILNEAVPTIITPEGVVWNILQDGRFKSQHETDTSRGNLDPDYRTEAETAMFGTPKELRAGRPIYGVFIHDFAEATKRPAHQYGEVMFVLKDSILDRTTTMFGNSLSQGFYAKQMMPRPYHTFDWKGIGPGGIYPRPNEPRMETVDHAFNYVEAQFHGGVTLKDVKEVMVPLAIYQEWQGRRSGEIEEFQKHGIPVRVIGPKMHLARI